MDASMTAFIFLVQLSLMLCLQGFGQAGAGSNHAAHTVPVAKAGDQPLHDDLITLNVEGNLSSRLQIEPDRISNPSPAPLLPHRNPQSQPQKINFNPASSPTPSTVYKQLRPLSALAILPVTP